MVGKAGSSFRRTTTHSKSPTVSFSAAATSCARDKIISSQFSRSRSDGRFVQNGRLGDLGVQLCFKKYFRFLLTQIIGLSPAIPSRERDVGHRHERWDGMRWTRQRRACNCGRRAVSVSDRGAQTNDVASGFTNASAVVHMPPRASWRRRVADGKNAWSWHPLLVLNRRRCCEPNRALQHR